MAINTINLGAAPTGAGGDTNRSAFDKINRNFTDTQHAASRLVGSDVGNVPSIDGAKNLVIEGVYYGRQFVMRDTRSANYLSSVINNQGNGNGTAVSLDLMVRDLVRTSCRTIEQGDGRFDYEISVTPPGSKTSRRDVLALTVKSNTTVVPSITAGVAGVAVATKKIMATYSRSARSVNQIAHGLDSQKILSVDVWVMQAGFVIIPPHKPSMQENYRFEVTGSHVIIIGVDDDNLLNKPVKIFIQYEV
ncbi:hypothetical protein A9308_00545 [Moraxella atlantae]|uniref:Uncharacterized protein n=1 Tax=Faucicola atlantae TaxID=34059 RepID=A0A1B8Q940_9GAMM|nr:hypothetical protein [Moraxella atlantae]OBX73732.1 hypothetical protein A9308_00545 [Moraxella atlantae]